MTKLDYAQDTSEQLVHYFEPKDFIDNLWNEDFEQKILANFGINSKPELIEKLSVSSDDENYSPKEDEQICSFLIEEHSKWMMQIEKNMFNKMVVDYLDEDFNNSSINEVQYKCSGGHKFFESEMITKKSPGSNCCDTDTSWHCPKCDSKFFTKI